MALSPHERERERERGREGERSGVCYCVCEAWYVMKRMVEGVGGLKRWRERSGCSWSCKYYAVEGWRKDFLFFFF